MLIDTGAWGGYWRGLAESGCGMIYIEPGSPWENPYIESLNGKLRDKCLNRETFRNILEAQIIIENWREEYNTQRPHSSLGYLAPAESPSDAGGRMIPGTPDRGGRH